jgi:hypothetical protein
VHRANEDDAFARGGIEDGEDERVRRKAERKQHPRGRHRGLRAGPQGGIALLF